MAEFVVTTDADPEGAATGDSLSLRQAIAAAAASSGADTITFAEGVSAVRLETAINISDTAGLVIDGDIDGDGIADVTVWARHSHQFSIGSGAEVTISDVVMGYSSVEGSVGAFGANGRQVVEHAARGVDGAELGDSGTDGQSGSDGDDAEVGANGGIAVGAIINLGDLTLERVGFTGTYVQGGNGGDGGIGGRGQGGGGGGWGRNGTEDFSAVRTDGGSGGHGGHGGHGGNGGSGGRGGDAAGAILNMEGGMLTLVDVAIGGRMPNGVLAAEFGLTARGGDGGDGGAGGVGGQAGGGGHGGNDAVTGREDSGRTVTFLNGTTANPDDTHEVSVYNQYSTDAGAGGHGGNAGNGGDAGGNGSGGHAAPIISYGSMTGSLASGTTSESEAGVAGTATGGGGPGGDGGSGGQGGNESAPEWLNPRQIGPWDTYAPGETHANTGVQPTAPDGRDGSDGSDGASRTRGEIGEARASYLSLGDATGLASADGLVYLAGAYQPEDRSELIFTIVRIGDTSAPLTVNWELTGGGAHGVSAADFAPGTALSGEVSFAALDQPDGTRLDEAGLGVQRVVLPVVADVFAEDPESFVIRLTGGSATLGTARLEGSMDDPEAETSGPIEGTSGADTLDGTAGADEIRGLGGADLLRGMAGNDTLMGGDGPDTLNGGDGDDLIRGGDTEADRRDVIYAGSGNDSVDGGYGNDLIFGQDGNDTLAGGFGADELQGQDGDDVITGSAFGDIVFGNAGDDFVNGGFGHDLINGGAGADKFFHVGVEGHGSDWVQDYSAAEGDVLVFGNAAATAAQFQVNTTHTANRETGERSGDDDTEEAFVIYKPTGQIMWALVDGAGQASINLQIGAETFDLLA